jgi:paired amphipathic helix protein Sin3a
MNVEDMIRDENVYRIEFVGFDLRRACRSGLPFLMVSRGILLIKQIAHENALTFQLLGKDDYSDDTTISQEEKWSLYVDRFVQLNATEGHTFRRREPFLKRHLPSEVPNDPPNNIVTHSGLELKICVNTYRITWVQNTEDYFHHKQEKSSKKLQQSMRQARNARFKEWQSREENAEHFSEDDVKDLFLAKGKYAEPNATTEEQTMENPELGEF